MQRNLASGFDDSFRRHLAVEQRRAVLDTIARELTPETTLGDIVDAAQDLGWGDSLGELRLSDLASALLGEGQAPPREPASREAPFRDALIADTDADHDDDDDATEASDHDAGHDLDADDDAQDDDDQHDAHDDDQHDDDEQDDDEQAAAPQPEAPKTARSRKTAAKAAAKAAARVEAPRKPSSLDRALDRIDKALAARGRKTNKTVAAAKSKASPAAKKAAASAKKVPAKKLSKKAPVPRPVEDEDDDTDAMSLDQAAKVLVPLVRKLKEATMQDLEEQTGMGRRKLRFHIGQLVKHGRLKRHGMGRGTCYTVK